MFTSDEGLSIGIDAGVQVPVSHSLSTTLPRNAPSSIDNTIATVADTLGNGVTPTVDLLRVGLLF